MITTATNSRTDEITVERTRREGPSLTRTACEGAVAFGVILDDLAPTQPAPSTIRLPMPRGGAALVVGPSGSGKSTLLEDTARAADHEGWTVVRPPTRTNGPRSCVDRVPGADVHQKMQALARAGLAEAGTALRAPGALSTGERERLRLALAIARADLFSHTRERVLLVVDELGAGLDRDTAHAVAHALGRFIARNARVRLLCATNRAEIAKALRPRTVVALDHDGAAKLTHEPVRAAPADRFRIEPGTYADLEALAKHHYRPGAPATVSRVLRATLIDSGALAGVLVTSMPTLNASWREHAWPGVFDTSDKREHAHELNRSLRCIARVIVAPEHRACGLAVRLVRHYLARPDTKRTEAVAAMGRACPFFERAGMTPHEPPIPKRDARLLDALHHAGVRERWRLATPTTALRRAIDGAGAAFIERELRAWANSSRATHAHKEEPLEHLFERACRTIASTPVVYTHEAT